MYVCMYKRVGGKTCFIHMQVNIQKTSRTHTLRCLTLPKIIINVLLSFFLFSNV